MPGPYLLLVIIFIVTSFLRTGYELLKDAGKIDPANKGIFAIIFLDMCALWVSWFSLCPLDPYIVDLPPAIRWGGLAIVILGTVVAVGGLLQLKGLEKIDHLVTTGLFRKLRHPMYTGFILWIVGWSLWYGALMSLAVGLPVLRNILYWRTLEERRLLSAYGETYAQYRLTTWF
jgi:protein-S-isoprenylcysteine O-methyltransferase Ste14